MKCPTSYITVFPPHLVKELTGNQLRVFYSMITFIFYSVPTVRKVMQSHPCTLWTCFPCKYVRDRGQDMLRCAVCCHVQNMHHSWSIQVHHITNNPCGNVYKCLDPSPRKIHQDTPLYTDPDAGRSLPYTLELEDRKNER